MRHIIKQRQAFECEELAYDAAMARLDEMGEPYKREYAEELFEKQGLDTLTFYRNGAFLDMCEGPHVENTGKLPKAAFKLRSVAGAYWRGDEKNVMMTRLYAWAFETREELDAHVKAYKEALARDHKKVGRELGLFIDDTVGQGLILWTLKADHPQRAAELHLVELELQARRSTPTSGSSIYIVSAVTTPTTTANTHPSYHATSYRT